MPFNKGRFCLFFSIPLSSQDWANLTLSKVRLVMMPPGVADAGTLKRMASMGIRVVLRVPESDYYDDLAPARIRNQVLAAMQSCPVEAVIVGVEPDGEFVLSYGSPTWGQQEKAYEHRRRFDAVRRMLQGVGVKVVSPGYKTAVALTGGGVGKAISEDDPAPAGFRDWVMINTLPDHQYSEFGYDAAEGNGVHIYLYSWAGIVDQLREMIDTRWYQVLLHKPLWIDEIGIGNASTTARQKMQGYIEIADIMLSRKNGRQHPLGQRCELLCPFISNGIPNGQWEAYFLLNDPACYVELGQWMSS
jgi:hypothetical protein